jgi:hypothetical protein
MTNLSKTLITVITILIVVLILYLTFSSQLSNREAGIISVLLTVLSFVVSYLISFHFAEESYKSAIEEVKAQHLANLKTYALNAAEKVSNLSNELTRLSIYLQEQLEEEDENLEMENHTLAERLESAIHIVNTLKSVNDTSLSDWRGVIGEELKEKKEEQIERENEVREIVTRFEELINAQNKRKNNTDNYQEIRELKKELSTVINTISGSYIKPRKSNKPTKQDVVGTCPSCSNSITYSQRPSEGSFKAVKCDNCTRKSTARWSQENGYYLEIEKEVISIENCEWCKEKVEFKYSSVPYTTTINQCSHCSGQVRVLTNINGIKLYKYGQNPFTSENRLTPELLLQIEKLLPAQPWPTGIHKEIANELSIPNYLVTNAITKLIEEGKFVPQVNGVLYERKSD